MSAARHAADERALRARPVEREIDLRPSLLPAPRDEAFARPRRVVEQDRRSVGKPRKQRFGRPAHQRMQSPGRAVDHEQADVGWQVGKLIPQTRPVAGRRPERRMAEVGEHALTCEPMRGGGDEYLMLVIRSEEHTSELQSLMRISYAVF